LSFTGNRSPFGKKRWKALSDLSLYLRKCIRVLAVSLQFIADDGNGGRKRQDNEANRHIDFRE